MTKEKTIIKLTSIEPEMDYADSVEWNKWKRKLSSLTAEMPRLKTMRYQALQSIAKEKIDEIHSLKANKTTKP